MSRFPVMALLCLTACSHTPVPEAPKQAALLEMTLDQDWREATDCVMREMEQGGLHRWPLRASSQAASFDFKNENSKIVVRNTEDMAALYTASVQKTGDNQSRFSLTPIGNEHSSLTALVESDLKRAAQTCE